MNLSERSRIAVAAAFLALSLPLGSALAQDATENIQHLKDFVHYVNVAKPELARAHLQKLLESGVTDAELAELIDENVEEERFNEALTRGRVVLGLTDIVARLESRYLVGQRDLARDSERIEEAINMLDGTLRQQRISESILMEAGEFAVPQLLEQVTGGENPSLRQKCVIMLEELGRYSVIPLSVAISELDTQSQIRVANILGRIGYSEAGPFLAEVAADPDVARPAREAASRAARRVGADTSDVAGQFADLGRRYFRQGEAMLVYPEENVNNIWSYDAFVGLVPTPVPTPIFNEVMSMRLSRTALQKDPTSGTALATYIASNLKRDNDLPQGETDPIYGDSKFTPEFYAVGAGPGTMNDVLALALDGRHTPLVRDAIDALGKTAGAGNLFGRGADSQPLLESLTYPDRRVRYDAALALGTALPAVGFAGDFQVVPLLASAVRAGDAAFALVLADEEEDQNTYSNWLADLGYQVVATGESVQDVVQPLSRAAGIDIVVVRQSPSQTRQTVDALRRNPRTSVAPVVVLTAATDRPMLAENYRNNVRVQVKTAPADSAPFGAIVDEAIERASGGRMTEIEALEYMAQAIDALEKIAISNSPVYDIRDAQSALIDALAVREGALRLKVADVLARIPTDDAQRALFNAAFTVSGDEQVQMLNRVARSARMHGDRAEQRHVARLLDLVQQGGDVGEAAARVHGALNLSPDNVVKIIAD